MTAAAVRHLAYEEVNRRTFWRGDTAPAAKALGLSRSHLISIRNGNAPMTDATAARILAAARAEEIAQADRIARELDAHWLTSGEAK